MAIITTGACGDEDGGDERATSAEAGGTTSVPDESGDILIKSHVILKKIPESGPAEGAEIAEGEVLEDSTIAGSAFCPGGKFTDVHGDDPAIGLVNRTFRCPDGTLRIGFTPGAPQGHRQTGPWEVIDGTGGFEGLAGSGQMEVVYGPQANSNEAQETFTGEITGS